MCEALGYNKAEPPARKRSSAKNDRHCSLNNNVVLSFPSALDGCKPISAFVKKTVGWIESRKW